MTIATLQKRLQKIVRKQEQVSEELRRVLASVKTTEPELPYDDWELKPTTLKRMERARKALAAGKGIVLRNEAEIRKFFCGL